MQFLLRPNGGGSANTVPAKSEGDPPGGEHEEPAGDPGLNGILRGRTMDSKGGAMETRNRSMLFKGLVVDIEQFEVRIGEKGWHTFQIVRHPGGVGVLPLHDDGTVTLIR